MCAMARQSSETNVDPIIARAIQAIQDKAEQFGVTLEGRVSISPNNRIWKVRQGRATLGRMTQDQLTRCDVDHLFVIRRAVWVDVVKPAGDTPWPEWSQPLFALQWALGQLKDAALDELRLSAHTGENEVPLATLAYRTIQSETQQQRLRQDALRRGRNSRTWADRATFSVGGATASCAGQAVHSAFQRWQRGEIGYPSWSGPKSSIPLRAAETSLTCLDEDIVLRFNATGTRQECLVRAKGWSAQKTIEKIIKGTCLKGDANLVWDEKKRRWRVSISYSMPRKQPAEGANYLAVRRNVHDMLFVMDSKGKTYKACQGIGLKIIHVRSHFLRRKSEIRATLNFQGQGARGHGKKRFYRSYTKCSDKEANAIDTMLKQLASSIRKAAESAGASSVLLEDFALPWTPEAGDPRFVRLLRRMPWTKAETLLRRELEEHGIRLVTMAQAHNTTTCPACGADLRQVDARHVECDSCQLLCTRAIVATWNMFLAAEVPVEELAEVKRKASFIGREIRRRNQEVEAAKSLADTIAAE